MKHQVIILKHTQGEDGRFWANFTYIESDGVPCHCLADSDTLEGLEEAATNVLKDYYPEDDSYSFKFEELIDDE